MRVVRKDNTLKKTVYFQYYYFCYNSTHYRQNTKILNNIKYFFILTVMSTAIVFIITVIVFIITKDPHQLVPNHLYVCDNKNSSYSPSPPLSRSLSLSPSLCHSPSLFRCSLHTDTCATS